MSCTCSPCVCATEEQCRASCASDSVCPDCYTAFGYDDLDQALINEQRMLIEAATQFALGRVGDAGEAGPAWVSVHRQYGGPSHQRWAVALCSEQHAMNVVMTCAEQSVALFYGKRHLDALRKTETDPHATNEGMYELKLTSGQSVNMVQPWASRAIVQMDGVYVMVDWVSSGEQAGRWELSGEPARPGPELEKLNALVKGIEGTSVVVTDAKGTEVFRRETDEE